MHKKLSVFSDKNTDGDLWDENWPVCMVSAKSAEAYCLWKSREDGITYRLPTELEWEKSARGVDGRWHVWGYKFDASYCCMTDSSPMGPMISPIGRYSTDISVYGVQDLAGNVQDWTSCSFYDENRELNEGARVVRGGSWDFFANLTRICYRSYAISNTPYSNIGFRLARSLEGK